MLGPGCPYNNAVIEFLNIIAILWSFYAFHTNISIYINAIKNGLIG